MTDPFSTAATWSAKPSPRSRHVVQILNHFVSVRGVVVRLVEFLLLLGAFSVVNAQFLGGPASRLATMSLYLFTTLCMLQSFALYQRHRPSLPTLVTRLALVYLGAGVVFAGVSLALPIDRLDEGRLAATLGGSWLLSLLLRLALPQLSAWMLPPIRVLVIGEGRLALEVVRIVRESDPMEGLDYCGLFDPRTHAFKNAFDDGVSTRTIDELIRQESIGEIVLASADQRGLPLTELLQVRMQGVLVTDYVSFVERERRYLPTDEMRPSWLLFSKGFDHGLARVVAKRLFDVIVSGLLLFVLLPFLCLAVITIFLESGRPIFFRQERVDTGGKPITILKLRSMVKEAERDGVPQWAGKNDQRITRAGRVIRLTRIDEIPQLIAVLKGDMSFVGPRPEREFFVKRLRAQIPFYDLRQSIKPGLSGWAQVSYPYGASVEDARAKLGYDLYYIKNHSLLLDVVILLSTIRVVICGKGAR